MHVNTDLATRPRFVQTAYTMVAQDRYAFPIAMEEANQSLNS